MLFKEAHSICLDFPQKYKRLFITHKVVSKLVFVKVTIWNKVEVSIGFEMGIPSETQ